MSLLTHIRFETTPPPPVADPVRMDIPLFVGHLSAKEAVPVASALGQWWAQQGYLSQVEKAQDAVSPYDRPVRVTSVADVLTHFTADRIDQRAVLTGTAPDGAIDGTLFSVVVDGVLRSTELSGDDPAAAALQIGALWSDLEVIFDGTMILSLPQSHGAGTLAVLQHEGLGFAQAKYSAARPVGSLMLAALAQFFAMGGREAYVVSMGPPLPLFARRSARALALGQLAAASGLDADDPEPALRQPMPVPHAERSALSGMAHVLGLDSASFLVLPELLEMAAVDRSVLGPTPSVPSAPVAFAQCLPEPAGSSENQLKTLGFPTLDRAGITLWQGVVARCLSLIATHRRDVMMLASHPKRALETPPLSGPHSAFLQLASPFVRTPLSASLPSGVICGDAVLAGQIAARLVSAQPYNSAALDALPQVRDVIPQAYDMPTCEMFGTGAASRLKRDVTTSDDPAWEAGPSSRLAARLLRMARVYGETLVFELISDQLMRQVQQRFEAMLQGVAAQGGVHAGELDAGVLCAL